MYCLVNILSYHSLQPKLTAKTSRDITHRCKKTLTPRIKNIKTRVSYEKNKKRLKSLNKKRC